jgi:hypothetical protein
MSLGTTLAIICVTALEVIALCNGINGALLAGSIAIIAGLGGYEVKRRVNKK